MDDQATKDAAAKQRIVSHMNNDHHDSVIRYLEHYHKLPSYTAYDGKISDISLTELTLSCGGKTYQTPFEPPMTSYREARERVVEMDKDCVSALNRSDITVKEFVAPYGWHLAEFILVSAVFVGFSTRSSFVPSSILSSILPSAFRRFCWTIQPYLLTLMVVLHTWETVNFSQSRLRKHNVNVRSSIYWLWIGTTFIEGVSSFMRFDKMIAQKKIEKERQKH